MTRSKLERSGRTVQWFAMAITIDTSCWLTWKWRNLSIHNFNFTRSINGVEIVRRVASSFSELSLIINSRNSEVKKGWRLGKVREGMDETEH